MNVKDGVIEWTHGNLRTSTLLKCADSPLFCSHAFFSFFLFHLFLPLLTILSISSSKSCIPFSPSSYATLLLPLLLLQSKQTLQFSAKETQLFASIPSVTTFRCSSHSVSSANGRSIDDRYFVLNGCTVFLTARFLPPPPFDCRKTWCGTRSRCSTIRWSRKSSTSTSRWLANTATTSGKPSRFRSSTSSEYLVTDRPSLIPLANPT